MVDKPTVLYCIYLKLVEDSERTKSKLLIFFIVLMSAFILATFGVSFICWIDGKKSHLKRVLRA